MDRRSAVVIAIGLLAVASAGAPAGAQVRLTILGGVVGGAGYLQAVGLNQVILDHLQGVAIPTVQGTPGYGANARRLAAGLGDVAVVVTVDGFDVLARRGDYRDARKVPLQMYPTVPPLYVHFIVKQSSGIRGFADLHGKRINVLTRGSLAEAVGTRLLEVLRIRPSRVYHFPHGDAAAGLQSGEIDVVTAGGIAPAYGEVGLREPLRVLSFTDEEAALVAERLPQIPVAEADFGASYRGAGKARVLAPWAVMAARHDLDAELVYRITKAVYENYATVVKVYKEAEGLTPAAVVQTRYPLHPGALRYYRDARVRIPGEMHPPASLPR
ncbi:MAG: TAXI family TRAP transporter solute-binding subunit [Armatimonadota bacterium]|nr:TAXI family TRAP transporter solute-binding subunit [Armatimonadota bacterium]MDR7485982.1 TAXI family TRAP transporter solute-binding subunit [Armatimonadota bacterium]MDR7534341.1 TAXI family TRAP transporter solute-binding subunit [Armatimonadota bacterium]MDR7536899.1 TAXI family TRAP transporter solute-binding subunit [Armatimonadota bacterium]